jgi:prevent-host-death family protein
VKIVNIQAAKKHLSRLIEEAAQGKEIILAKAGRPMARLVPYKQKEARRKLGLFRGKIRELPGCWDTDPSMEAEFARPAL